MLETRIATAVRPESDARLIAREFRSLLERGVRIRAAGTARADPARLLPTYLPKHAIRLFDTTYYLTDLRVDRSWEGTMRFFAAWVLPTRDAREIYPRVFGKDFSLVWRSPSHFVRSERENWMGKGDVRWVVENGDEVLATFEETTNLPLEIQGALDALDARARERGAGAFAALTDADRELVLNEYSAADPGFLPGLVFQTYCAYYQSARVVSALGVEPRPPYPLGYPLEQPDLDALLEPVRAREKLYREV